MGIIRDLKLKMEELENNIKIMEGIVNKLKINVDLVNFKPKQLPDAFTHKPQQPYVGVGVRLKLIKESIVYIRGTRIHNEYISSDKFKWYILVRELKVTTYTAPNFTILTNIDVSSSFSYEDGKYKFVIGAAGYTSPDNYYYQDVHYKIYEVYDFGELKLLT